MMMKLRFYMLFACWPCLLFAQQRPHYTQYILNNYIVNPAISGIENYVDLKLSARNQWVGLDGAPRTFYLTVHGPLGKTDHRSNATSFNMKGENPRGREYWTQYQAAAPHHGIGLTMVNYSTGYINRTTAFATYAYHLGLSATTSLAAGFGAGFSSFNVDRTKILLATAFDPAIGVAVGQLTQMKPEVNAGLWLYGTSFFAGLSAQQIMPVNTPLVNDAAYRSTQVPHVFATAGYRFLLTDDISGIPSVMTRYVASLPLSIDVNFKAQYLDLLWVGAGYRKGEGFSGLFGLNISQRLNISYSYDVNKSPYLLSTVQRGTHEMVIGFLLRNGYGDLCPRNVW